MGDVELIPLKEAIERSGLPTSTWFYRLRQNRDDIRVYQDGRDRRKHLIDARDLPKLTDIRPAPRRDPQGAA